MKKLYNYHLKFHPKDYGYCVCPVPVTTMNWDEEGKIISFKGKSSLLIVNDGNDRFFVPDLKIEYILIE